MITALNKYEKEELREISKYLTKLQTYQRRMTRIPGIAMSISMIPYKKAMTVTVSAGDDMATCEVFTFYVFNDRSRNAAVFDSCVSFIEKVMEDSVRKLL